MIILKNLSPVTQVFFEGIDAKFRLVGICFVKKISTCGLIVIDSFAPKKSIIFVINNPRHQKFWFVKGVNVAE